MHITWRWKKKRKTWLRHRRILAAIYGRNYGKLINIPSKLKLFGWRALHEGLATLENFVKREMEGEIRCPMCGEDRETIMPTLIECEEVRRMWKQSPLRLKINEHRCVSFRN